MKTNSKEVRAKIDAHILECVYSENEETYSTIKEACTRLRFEFERVANYEYNMRRIPNHQERFTDWLRGLPFHFYYYNSDIEDFLNGLGINPNGKEYTSEQMWKLYGYLIYCQMLKHTK
jgi:hypothetical protein